MPANTGNCASETVSHKGCGIVERSATLPFIWNLTVQSLYGPPCFQSLFACHQDLTFGRVSHTRGHFYNDVTP